MYHNHFFAADDDHSDKDASTDRSRYENWRLEIDLQLWLCVVIRSFMVRLKIWRRHTHDRNSERPSTKSRFRIRILVIDQRWPEPREDKTEARTIISISGAPQNVKLESEY